MVAASVAEAAAVEAVSEAEVAPAVEAWVVVVPALFEPPGFPSLPA